MKGLIKTTDYPDIVYGTVVIFDEETGLYHAFDPNTTIGSILKFCKRPMLYFNFSDVKTQKYIPCRDIIVIHPSRRRITLKGILKGVWYWGDQINIDGGLKFPKYKGGK